MVECWTLICSKFNGENADHLLIDWWIIVRLSLKWPRQVLSAWKWHLGKWARSEQWVPRKMLWKNKIHPEKNDILGGSFLWGDKPWSCYLALSQCQFKLQNAFQLTIRRFWFWFQFFCTPIPSCPIGCPIRGPSSGCGSPTCGSICDWVDRCKEDELTGGGVGICVPAWASHEKWKGERGRGKEVAAPKTKMVQLGTTDNHLVLEPPESWNMKSSIGTLWDTYDQLGYDIMIPFVEMENETKQITSRRLVANFNLLEIGSALDRNRKGSEQWSEWRVVVQKDPSKISENRIHLNPK